MIVSAVVGDRSVVSKRYSFDDLAIASIEPIVWLSWIRQKEKRVSRETKRETDDVHFYHSLNHMLWTGKGNKSDATQLWNITK